MKYLGSEKFVVIYSLHYCLQIVFLSFIPTVHTHTTDEVIKNNDLEMKFILKWPNANIIPWIYDYLEKGQDVFMKNSCQYTNCFVSSMKDLLGDYTKFDVIVFAGFPNETKLPKVRLANQKYGFVCMESADVYPVCDEIYNDYFNFTFTYKLDSDVRWPYITIRDEDSTAIGPNKDMRWLKVKDMEATSDELKEKFSKKSKTAAWFVSCCETRGKRENYVRKLIDELESYNLTIDVYGKCSDLVCPVSMHSFCMKLVDMDYYFYLSFENSLSEDYVTEKLLTAVMNNAIPIVYGGANYTRFMPDGTYLNARELGPKKLAEEMNYLIHNPNKYYNYFRWHKHYQYHYNDHYTDTNGVCALCRLLNNESFMNSRMSYKNFVEWWTPSRLRCNYKS